MSIVESYIITDPFENFNYWFTRKEGDTFYVGQKTDNFKFSTIGEITWSEKFSPISDDRTYKEYENDIIEDFRKFQHRPEFEIGFDSQTFYEIVKGDEICDIITIYKRLLLGSVLVRSYKYSCKCDEGFDIDKCKEVKQVMRAIDWLDSTDFFECPASTRYHDNEETGLARHSLKVAVMAADLCKLSKFKDKVNVEDAVFVALIHDWCKIGLYDSYMRNVKDKDGKWTQKKEYKYRSKSLTSFGHGVSSMFLAQKFFKLSLDELLAIRWHMGFCRVADSDMNELQQSNENHPLVHLLQFADQLSITNY